MSIDYEEWKDALAMTESVNNPEAWGDHNDHRLALAAGRWQIHPAFMWDWWQDQPRVQASWDEVLEQALRTFFDERSQVTSDPVQLAMEFHLGIAGVKAGQFDQVYADRFKKYYRR